MINVNLSTSWDWKTNIFETASNITANPTTGSVPPQVVNGALYQGTQDDDSIYLYGGTTSYANVSFPGWQGPVAPTYSLWSYDPGSAQWSQFDVSHNAPYRPSNGAAAEAVDQGLAFYYNGELDNGSSEQELGIIAGTNVFLSGMVVINTTDQTARNLSTAQVSGDLARAHARMQYIPGAGEKGVLVLIGGSTFPANQLHSTDIVNLVYHTASLKWSQYADLFVSYQWPRSMYLTSLLSIMPQHQMESGTNKTPRIRTRLKYQVRA